MRHVCHQPGQKLILDWQFLTALPDSHKTHGCQYSKEAKNDYKKIRYVASNGGIECFSGYTYKLTSENGIREVTEPEAAKQPWVEAVAVTENKIVYVGSNRASTPWIE